MSELKRVLSLARQDFIPALTRHGFARHRSSGAFFKKVGELLHIVSVYGTRSGGTFAVHVDVWSPGYLDEREANPPSRSELAHRTWLGGQLSPWRVDTGNWAWSIDSDDEVLAALKQATQCFEDIAVPWFAALSQPAAVTRAMQLRHEPVDIVNQIELHGGQRLSERLRTLGFVHEGPPLMHFVRQRGPYVQVLLFESVSSALQANIWVHVATKWTAEAVYGSTRKPDEAWLPVNGGLLGTLGLDQGHMAWRVDSPDAVVQTLSALLAAIEAHALPWFDATSTRDAYLLSIRSDRLPMERRARLLQVLRNKLPA